MFGLFNKLDEDITILQGYLDVNNIMYQEEIIKEQIDEFDEKYKEKLAKNKAGVKGYEKYTDRYVYLKRVELFQQLFDEYYGLHDVAKALKYYLMTHNKNTFKDANMTFGSNPVELTVTEILLNEEIANKVLSNLKIKKMSKDVYKRN